MQQESHLHRDSSETVLSCDLYYKNLFSHVKVLITSHHIASKMETKQPSQTYSKS